VVTRNDRPPRNRSFRPFTPGPSGQAIGFAPLYADWAPPERDAEPLMPSPLIHGLGISGWSSTRDSLCETVRPRWQITPRRLAVGPGQEVRDKGDEVVTVPVGDYERIILLQTRPGSCYAHCRRVILFP
jgi:hypothetical protein